MPNIIRDLNFQNHPSKRGSCLIFTLIPSLHPTRLPTLKEGGPYRLYLCDLCSASQKPSSYRATNQHWQRGSGFAEWLSPGKSGAQASDLPRIRSVKLCKSTNQAPSGCGWFQELVILGCLERVVLPEPCLALAVVCSTYWAMHSQLAPRWLSFP